MPVFLCPAYLLVYQIICIFILLLGRVINLAMPLTLGKLINVLEGRSDGSPLPYLFGYVGLRFLQGSGGLSAIRDVGFSDPLSSLFFFFFFLSSKGFMPYSVSGLQ